MNTRQTFIVFLLLFSLTANAQLLSFDKSTLLSNAPALRKTVQCANGDLVSVFSGNVNVPNAFSVIRYDEDGDFVWQKEYLNQSVSSCSANDVTEASNGDLIIAFSALNNTQTSGLIRITSQGTLLWERLYSTGSMLSDVFVAYSKVVEATDGSIFLALADINVSQNPSTEAMILFRFSASGNLLWGKSPGLAPPMVVVQMRKAAAGGVHIGASSNINGNTHLITFDSAGVVTRSLKYNYTLTGNITDFVTDANHRPKAILGCDYQTWTRLVELDSTGNVTAVNEASIAATSWGTDLLWLGGGYVSLHEMSGGGTMLCSWSAGPSLTNGLQFTNSSSFTAFDFFAAADGGIYLSGISAASPQTQKTRFIKTKPMIGFNFPSDGCAQATADFTIVSAGMANPLPQALVISAYSPVVENSSFQVQTASANVINNCSLVSIDETLQTGFEVYPNPATDLVNVSGRFSGDVMVEIYAATGQLLLQSQMHSGTNSLTLNTSMLPEGVYLLKLSDGNRQPRSAKLVISR
ncbi:MAG: T9SS type A sorting domain-containing protein [Bacteroidetes bacterium]|nr:T9SS type A sorting domain-containing protein [Bacteroidota bacterium]